MGGGRRWPRHLDRGRTAAVTSNWRPGRWVRFFFFFFSFFEKEKRPWADSVPFQHVKSFSLLMWLGKISLSTLSHGRKKKSLRGKRWPFQVAIQLLRTTKPTHVIVKPSLDKLKARSLGNYTVDDTHALTPSFHLQMVLYTQSV